MRKLIDARTLTKRKNLYRAYGVSSRNIIDNIKHYFPNAIITSSGEMFNPDPTAIKTYHVWFKLKDNDIPSFMEI